MIQVIGYTRKKRDEEDGEVEDTSSLGISMLLCHLTSDSQTVAL